MALADITDTVPVLPLDSIVHGDALDVLRGLPDNSIDAIVTDPPYGLGTPPDMTDVLRAWLAGEAYRPRGRGFMGKAWDAFVPGPEYWRECLRVLKPGGHALVFAGTRTWDVMGLALRLAAAKDRDTGGHCSGLRRRRITRAWFGSHGAARLRPSPNRANVRHRDACTRSDRRPESSRPA